MSSASWDVGNPVGRYFGPFQPLSASVLDLKFVDSTTSPSLFTVNVLALPSELELSTLPAALQSLLGQMTGKYRSSLDEYSRCQCVQLEVPSRKLRLQLEVVS